MMDILRGSNGIAESMITDLREALADAALHALVQGGPVSEAEAGAAALRLAYVLGRCRVYGIVLPEELQGDLPPEVALAACRFGTEAAQELIASIQRLPQLWDEVDPVTAEALCLDTLQARHDLWCCNVAIDDALDRVLEELPESSVELEQAFDNFQRAVEALDEILLSKDIAPLLATVSSAPLLENWRKMLAFPYDELLPWWLDDTLPDIRRQEWESAESFYQELIDAQAPAVSPEYYARRATPIWTVDSLTAIPLAHAVAAAPKYLALRVSRLITWRSPDNRFKAVLSLPHAISAGELFCIEFRRRDDSPAKELAGVNVRFCTVELQIDQEGLARLPWETVRDQLRSLPALAPLQLHVDGVEWPQED
ncbi:MAG: hypothetical protein KatS3mg110_2246 [Pirellulaceae bacterium]|nr:MAG: hypothetical protein KatS3mg110_2246 [Pirellulaceae bacterium]